MKKIIEANELVNDALDLVEVVNVFKIMGESELDQVLNHPVATVRMLISIGGAKSLERAIPYLEKAEMQGETVTLRKVMHETIKAYGVPEDKVDDVIAKCLQIIK